MSAAFGWFIGQTETFYVSSLIYQDTYKDATGVVFTSDASRRASDFLSAWGSITGWPADSWCFDCASPLSNLSNEKLKLNSPEIDYLEDKWEEVALSWSYKLESYSGVDSDA